MAPKRSSNKTKKVEAAAERDETYDMASIPMDDDHSSAATPQSSAPPAAARGAKSKRGAAAAAAIATSPAKLAASSAITPTDVDGGTLANDTLEALIDGAAVGSAVDAILHRFRQADTTTALCALLNVVAKASGVTDVELDANALTEGIDISPLLEELYMRVPEDSAAYLLASKDNKHRRIRRGYPDFFEKLVQLAFSADLLLGGDSVLLPTLTQWIIPMSESKSRSFRHTATVTLLAMLHGLHRLVADLKARMALTRVKKEVTELSKKLDDIVQWRDHIFSQGIHQRVRDIAAEIRMPVIQSIKEWILDFPDECMVSKYLRYFSMSLHDRRPELRAEGLEMTLQALARVPDAYSRMRPFLQHFMGRFVEMSNDVDVRCSELSIRVVAMIVRCCDGDDNSNISGGDESPLYTNEMIDRVLLTLFDERPTVRTAAGILLKTFIHCRTAAGETDEAEQVRVATELLCSFASTLRSHYLETMPEKYLIDALWSNERPPLMLTEFAPMLDVATGSGGEGAPMESVVGLSLLTALLLKIHGRLTLGPLPKDDRRQVGRKMAPAVQETVKELSQKVSEALGASLCGIIEKHRGDQQVLCAVAHAVAAMDMTVFTTQRQSSQISALLLELRKATLSAPCAESTRDALVAAWHALAFTEHPLKNEAQAHLQELLKQILKQLAQLHRASSSASSSVTSSGNNAARTKAAQEALQVWGRVNLISSLVSVVSQWPIMKAALTHQLQWVMRSAPHDLELVEWMMGAGVNSVLWHISVQRSDPSVNPDQISEHLAELVTSFFQVLDTAADQLMPTSSSQAAESQHETHVANVSVRSKALLHLLDVCALRYYDLLQTEQDALVRHFEAVLEHLSAQLREAQELLKVTLSQHVADSVLSPIAVARQQCSHLEAVMMRLTVGVSRLFLFKRLDASLAPRVLAQWTQVPSKALSDTFKSLFHALRDRLGDSFPLERDMMVVAYNHCAEVGATALSVEALYQTGSKLASLHFMGTDRYYESVTAMVRFGIEFASSTDPLMLQGIAPYCSKLRVADAVALLRHDMAAVELFTLATNTYARAFVSAVRRAAKLRDADSQGTTAATSVKRSRELTLPTSGEGDEALLAAIAEAVPHTSFATPRGGRASAGKKVSMATRAVTDDGWRHVVGGSQSDVSVSVTPSAEGVHSRAAQYTSATTIARRSVVDVPSTQETAMADDGLDDREVFIATQEYE